MPKATDLPQLSARHVRRHMLGTGLLAGVSLAAGQDLMRFNVTPMISTGAQGSGMDYLARRLSEQFAIRLGGSYPVESMQAAGGSVAANAVLNRPAGGALLVAHSGLFCTYPVLNSEPLSFNPMEDLIPIGIPVGAPVFVITGKTSGITDLAHLRSWRGRQLPYAASLVGATGHIAGQMLLSAMRIEPLPIFYTMNRQALLDVAEARVPLGLFGWPAFTALADAGRVTCLCVLSDQRASFAPQVPTAKELGLSISIEGWVGLFSKIGTPASLLQVYSQTTSEFLSGPTLSQFLSVGGFSKLDVRLSEAAAFVRKDVDRYAEIIKRYNIRIP